MNCAFIFPGQGSQYTGMGLDIYNNFSSSKKLLDDASNFVNIDFKNLLFEENKNLSLSEFTQPAILLNSLMTYIAFTDSIKLNADFLMGHSLGEFSALAVAEAFSYLEAIRIVNLRGKFMQQDCDGKDAAMMVVLGLSDDKIIEICKTQRDNKRYIYASNFNCDGQVVISGLKQDLKDSEIVFKEAGAKRALLLDMSVASHCPLLNTASNKLVDELKGILNPKFLPVISNVNAKSYNSKDEALVLLKEQLISPVLYKRSILSIEDKVDLFFEFGSSVLKNINKKITKKPTLSITDMKSLEEAINFMEKS